MAELDYPPVVQEDEEEQRRRAAPYAMFPPVRPPAQSYEINLLGDVTPGIGRARGEIASRPPDIGPAPIPEAPPIVTNQPAKPPGPAAAAYESLRAKGPAWEREKTGGRILDILGMLTPEGRRIETGSGLGSLGYQSQLGTARLAAETETKHEQEEARTAQADLVPMKVPWSDAPIYVQRKDMAAIQRQIGQTAGQKEITGQKTASAEKIATGKEVSAEKIATGKETSAEKIAAGKEASAEKIAEGRNLTAKDIANARNMVAREIAQIRTAAGNDPNKLTMATKNIMQLARSLQPEIDTGIDLTQKMQNIGPISSRWRDLWANKIGTPDPRFVEYKDHIGFLMTGITLAHARGRMSNELFEHFMEMFNAGKQSPENMVAALQVAKHWMDNYANLDKTATQSNLSAPARPKGVPAEAIWNEKSRTWQMPTNNK